MEDQVLAVLRDESGITETDCVAAIEAAASQGGKEGDTAEAIADRLRSDALTRDELGEIRGEPQVDKEQRAVAFVDEFGQGPVMQHIDGRWMLAGVATR